LEKQATISADEPCLYGCTHCIFAGVRQFGFRSSIDPDCMGIDFADGTCPHLLETEAADEKTSGYGGAAFRKIPYFRSDGAAGTGEDQVYYQLLKMAGKSMLEQIGEVERERLAYKEYIEQWIHEIKTPITAMKLLCENHRTDWTKELLLELEKTNRFTEQALYYARSEHTEKDYSVREMALSQVVHQAIADNKYLLLQGGMRLEVEEMQNTVYSDEKWVRFILNQLIANAVKYRTEQPVLRISTHKRQDQVVLVMEDNGIGIAASDLPRIFEKGFTGQNGRMVQQSTGIGLYLCKRLCEKLGIGIAAESSEQGTAISLAFHINCLIHEVQG
jgi:hypothetical protein